METTIKKTINVDVNVTGKIIEAIELQTKLKMCIKEMQKKHPCKQFLPSKEIAEKFNIDRFSELNTLLSMFKDSL